MIKYCWGFQYCERIVYFTQKQQRFGIVLLIYLDIHHTNMYCPKNMQNAGPVFPHNLLTPAYSSRLRGECSMINYVLRCACCVFHKKQQIISDLAIWDSFAYT